MIDSVRLQIKKELEALAETFLAGESMELVDLDFQREGKRLVVRLYIDQEGGVSIEDCARVSRQFGDVLDVKDLIPGAYVLEVSSPGLNRRLRKPEDFGRFQGSRVKVRLTAKRQGSRKLVGTLAAVDKDAIRVVCDGIEHTIGFEEIERANLIYEF